MKTLTIVPATFGWFTAVPCQDGESKKIDSILWEPVIAWHIETEVGKDGDSFHSIIPITVEGGIADYQTLKRPDGSITNPGDRDYTDEKNLIDELNQAQIRSEQKKAKKP